MCRQAKALNLLSAQTWVGADSKGIDLSADYKQNFSNSFGHRSGATSLTQPTNINISRSLIMPSHGAISLASLSAVVMVMWPRLFVDDQEAKNSPTQRFSDNGIAPKGGDIKYRDLNNDGKIDNLDLRSWAIRKRPKLFMVSVSLPALKGLICLRFSRGRQGYHSLSILPGLVLLYPSPDAYVYGNTQVLQGFADSHWSEEHQDLYASYPRLGVNPAMSITNNLQPSTWWLRDASFLRLKIVRGRVIHCRHAYQKP
jgi:hypothetical protein